MAAAKEILTCKRQLENMEHVAIVPEGAENFVKGIVRNENK